MRVSLQVMALAKEEEVVVMMEALGEETRTSAALEARSEEVMVKEMGSSSDTKSEKL